MIEFDCQSCGACCKAPVADLCDPKSHEPGRCSKLLGIIGQDVGCAIYQERPQACRDFESGSMECRLMRLEKGVA